MNPFVFFLHKNGTFIEKIRPRKRLPFISRQGESPNHGSQRNKSGEDFEQSNEEVHSEFWNVVYAMKNA